MHDFSYQVSEPVNGQDVSLNLVLHSDSPAARPLSINISVQAMRYNGSPAVNIQTDVKEETLQPGKGDRTEMRGKITFKKTLFTAMDKVFNPLPFLCHLQILLSLFLCLSRPTVKAWCRVTAWGFQPWSLTKTMKTHTWLQLTLCWSTLQSPLLSVQALCFSVCASIKPSALLWSNSSLFFLAFPTWCCGFLSEHCFSCCPFGCLQISGDVKLNHEATVEVGFINPINETLKDCALTVSGSGLMQENNYKWVFHRYISQGHWLVTATGANKHFFYSWSICSLNQVFRYSLAWTHLIK